MTTAVTYPLSRQVMEWVSSIVPSDMDVHVSDQELERRWNAVRRAMQEQAIDVLVAYGPGYSRWFTDREDLHPVNPHVMCDLVIFPRDEGMTTIGQGAPGDVENPSGRRGVKRYMSWATGGAAVVTQHLEAEAAEKALQRYASAKIGIVGAIGMSHSTAEYLKQRLTKATFVDASELVDAIKVIKSKEELAFCRRAAVLEDEAMEAVFSILKPGVMLCQATIVADMVAHRHGSVLGSMLAAGTGPQGAPGPMSSRNSTRKIEEGDQFNILIECYGPGGMYAELGRTCVVGKAAPQTKEEVAFAVEAQKYTVNMLRPGMSGPEIWEAHNKFMREHDRPEETRLYCHGQGYDLVERPLVRPDDPMKIETNMNITCHPGFVRNGFRGSICDNFFIGENGNERIHTFTQELLELG